MVSDREFTDLSCWLEDHASDNNIKQLAQDLVSNVLYFEIQVSPNRSLIFERCDFLQPAQTDRRFADIDDFVGVTDVPVVPKLIIDKILSAGAFRLGSRNFMQKCVKYTFTPNTRRVGILERCFGCLQSLFVSCIFLRPMLGKRHNCYRLTKATKIEFEGRAGKRLSSTDPVTIKALIDFVNAHCDGWYQPTPLSSPGCRERLNIHCEEGDEKRITFGIGRDFFSRVLEPDMVVHRKASMIDRNQLRSIIGVEAER